MSVIIRLQNLPWSANAADIRHFFHGLSIPDGGVHIVGGKLGDAFIAFSTDEDARQGMSFDGRMLKDSCVKLYLSSRTEMQKIIEETRQQHLALQAASVSASTSAQRPFGNVGQPAFMTAPTSMVATPSISAGHLPNNISTQIRPSNFANSHIQQHTDLSQNHIRPEGFDANFSQRQVPQQLYNPHIQQLEKHKNAGREFHRENHHHMPGMNAHQDQTNYAPPNIHQSGPKQFMASHHFRGPTNEFQMGLSGRDNMSRPMNDQGIQINNAFGEDRIIRMDRRDSAGTPELDRNREMERGGIRNKERLRGNRDRDRERGFRRGRRSRSRSRSLSPRSRRRRSRSFSPERRRLEKERDRNGKSNKSLLPTPPIGQSESRNKTPTEFSQMEELAGTDTCIQFRLLTGELSYRDIREYFRGIITPANSIKMINALDGNRFGLAFIQFSSSMDKQKALARQHGLVRGHQVQLYHVEDSTFDQAIDSYSPGVAPDAKILSHSCLGLRDFPPTGNPNSVRESFGVISIGQVFPERNEIGTVTGLCYVQLSSEADARKSLQLLRDGIMISGRQVKIALLPLNELEVCAKNLDRLRDVLMSANARTQTNSPAPPMNLLSPNQMIPDVSFNNAAGQPFHVGNGNESFNAIQRPRSSSTMHRVLISGLPPNFMERDVGDFFSDVGVIPQLIEVVYDDNRVSNGSAYCQFCSSEEAERALDKNGGFLDGHTVTVSLVHNPDEPVEPIVHAYNDKEGDHSFNTFERNLSEGRDSIKMHNYNRQSANTNYNRTIDNDMPFQQIGPRGPRHSLRGGFGGGPRHHVPMNLRNTGIRNNRSGVQSESSSPPPNGFGAPGCVVALSNVHPRAVIADILDFFRGFQLNEKCVIRRFGRNGEPTGDARVSFASPEDAVRAVRNFQNEHMLNRRITLSIV